MCSEICIDQLSLNGPGQVIGKGLDQHQVAGFSDEGYTLRGPALGPLQTKRPNFGRLGNVEIIHALDEVHLVVIESLTGRSLRPLVYSVDFLHGHDPLALVLFDGQLRLVDDYG